jgi:glyoxylase-like metal-dependent hydrolase (beta-lactamase superfamily II)
MANADESKLDYPLGDALPATGTVIELASGVRWLRMPLPFALDHINLWLLRDRGEDGREGWAIVDCGVANDATRAAWEQVFEHHLDGLPVLRVIVTHMHPDHIGNAHWLTERWGCRLWISATDWNASRLASQSTTGFGGDGAATFFGEHGLVDPEAIAKVRARSGYYASMVPEVPRRFRRLLDGKTLRIGANDWRCIAGYGHAPEHISLHCAALGVLISGDMVLPRISTNVSVIDIEPEADPLPLFLASIARCASCRPTRWCCLRTASRSRGCTSACASSRSTTKTSSPRRSPPAATSLAAPPTWCRSCFAASWTCTRPPSRWAKPWRTCMRWPARADCVATWMRTASGASRSPDAPGRATTPAANARRKKQSRSL